MKGERRDFRRDIYPSIDLHRMRADEATDAVDKFIDSQVAQGVTVIKIIHGWGTGKIHNEIQNFLRSHPDVASVQRPLTTGDASFIVQLKSY